VPESPLTIRSHLRSYEVVFTDEPERSLQELRDPKAYVIADPAALVLLGREGTAAVDAERLLVLEPSEGRKTMTQVQDLVAWLVDSKARKDCHLVALGGGVIQDLTAFTASIIFRGIGWVFIPSTLLAQADSCIGSKTSINVGGSKNIVGNFYPPVRVVIDSRFLDSLPAEEICSGIGEMMHYFVYADSELLEPMVADYDRLLVDRTRLQPFIAESLRIKRSVIEDDEFDGGERNKFNYGHSFGHALEALTGFRLRHGQAVTVGMDLANYLSTKLGILTMEDDARLHGLLRVNFPQYAWDKIDLDSYLNLLGKDKKNVDDDLTCILCEGAGRLTKRKIPLDGRTRSMIGDYFLTGIDRGRGPVA